MPWIWRHIEKKYESKAEHEEVPMGEAAMETFGALKKWYGDRHLAVGAA
jgi:hypothetical protein